MSTVPTTNRTRTRATTFLFFPPLLAALAAALIAGTVAQGGGTCAAGDHACEVTNAKEEAFFNTYSSPEAQANSKPKAVHPSLRHHTCMKDL